MTRPTTAQNIEISGVHGGCNDFVTSNCTLLAIYFIIFQRFASNALSKRLHPRRGAEMGFCKWGLSIFKARSDSRLDFLTLSPFYFGVKTECKKRVQIEGANRRNPTKISFHHPLEKSVQIDPCRRKKIDPLVKIRLTPKKSWRRGSI